MCSSDLDTGLADYKATAHGLLTFLAQLGEGYPDPPQVVRADEIAVEVYWRAPNQSKQRIVGRRDTLLLPTDIAYHRDHLAIVQNNFPAIIRLGDGDEVRDVPHPLSARGREAYDFATTDLSAVYFDVLKDRLYTTKADSKERRAAQSALHHIAQSLLKLMAPILSFTAEEAWRSTGAASESIFMETWHALRSEAHV